jgi:acrylyl-CoA reductase (NADPH)
MGSLVFKALRVEENSDRTFNRSVRQMCLDDLPDNDILVRVRYSSLNYKDALSASGNRGVTKSYPHTPGIDAAGIVEKSRSERFKEGEPVIVTSYDLGMNTPGGFGQYIRVPAEWVVKLPRGLSLEQSMILGTAGFTAGMSVEKLTAAVPQQKGPILVTGATGGVGSLACAILCHLGYSVTAVSGKPDTGLLNDLGVKKIISRQDFVQNADAPILKARWAGVIDTVGGPILSTAVKSTDLDGVVTCCGNVASPDLPLNVFPFILRGVALMGIDSQHCPMDIRERICSRLATRWRFDGFSMLAEKVGLDGLNEKIEKILAGRLQGRTLVSLD